MAAVDQHRQLHGARPAVVTQRVQGRACGSARIQHVVDEHHELVLEAAVRQRGRLQRPVRTPAKIVPIQRDVQYAGGHPGSGEPVDQRRQPPGEVDGRDAVLLRGAV